MKIPKEVIKKIEKFVENEIDERIKDYPIYIFLNGVQVDVDNALISNGEVNIFINSPVADFKTGEIYDLALVSREKGGS